MTEPPLAGETAGPATVARLAGHVTDIVADGAARRGGPIPAGHPAAIAWQIAEALGDPLPSQGTGADEALRRVTGLLASGSADPADPNCAAHLQCPPLAVAAAADLAVSMLNPSLDSWDQAPAATTIEAQVIARLARLVGYDRRAAGVATSGGTESNLMGLLLARDAAIERATGGDAAAGGIPSDQRLRVYCSEVAHFSVQRSAAVLGLGEDSVVPVPTDAAHRMDPHALDRLLDADVRAGIVPVAVVATAGTTDLGAIDPLPTVADVAAHHGAWLHVDAAYGGGALFSDRLAGLLVGLDRADSVALDLHKLGWQPVAAGIFLARRGAAFDPLARTVAYLNPVDDEAAGYTSLLGRSLRTTRRADVAKLAVTFRALGRDGLGALVDHCHDLACHAAARLRADDRFAVAADPVLTTVVFRFRATGDPDRVNAAVRRRLLRAGTAVVGRTELGTGREVWLKLTLLNPRTRPDDLDRLLDTITAAGVAETRTRDRQPATR